jgi:hypothetical protein
MPYLSPFPVGLISHEGGIVQDPEFLEVLNRFGKDKVGLMRIVKKHKPHTAKQAFK